MAGPRLSQVERVKIEAWYAAGWTYPQMADGGGAGS